MRDIQKSINNFSRVDGLHLSSILKYQETEIITVVENNIKQHYMFEYINRFVNVVFNAKGSLNPDIKKELHKVKNDLRTGTLTCNMKYHKWLNKYRYMIVPREYEESYYYDIKKYPQKYLVNMLWVNKMLDVYGAKKYNFLPQRTDIIIKYSQIDTKAIIEILDKCNKTVCLSDLTNNQNDIWNTYSSIKRKYSKDYMFDYCIITDGYACSIRYVEKTQYENQLQKKEKMRKGRLEIKGKSEEEKKTIRDIKAEERKEKEQEKITNKEKIKSKKTVLPDDEKDKAKKIKPKKTKEEKYIEFPYIDEIDSMDLLTIKNPCQCEPGLTNPMTITKPNGDVYKYTKKRKEKNI